MFTKELRSHGPQKSSENIEVINNIEKYFNNVNKKIKSSEDFQDFWRENSEIWVKKYMKSEGYRVWMLTLQVMRSNADISRIYLY